MSQLSNAKALCYGHLHALARRGGGAVEGAYHPDAVVHAVHPWNELSEADQIASFWDQIKAALPDMERHDKIFVAGDNQPDARVTDPRPPHLVASMGGFLGTFEKPFLGITPTQKPVYLRSCEAHWVEDGRIRESWMMLDLLDLMDQAGQWPLAHQPLGDRGRWFSPTGIGGALRLSQTDPVGGLRALDIVLAMHGALASYDGVNLDTMQHAQYWHPDFMWYGPSGIGATRRMRGFQQQHQIPFLEAFPDRAGAGHYIRIGDGDFAVTGGWPSVVATHTGPFLGMAPSGKRIDMRVMDFYRIKGSVIAENWVPIDIIYMARQMGYALLPGEEI